MTEKKGKNTADETALKVADKFREAGEALVNEAFDKAVADAKGKVAFNANVPGSKPVKEATPVKKPVTQRMKKAVEGAEKLGASATPVVVEKGPKVIVGGMRLTPIKTGIRPNGPQGDLYSVDGREFWIPHQVLHNQHTQKKPTASDAPWDFSSSYEAPEMSLFVFTYDGQTFYVLMDDNSSFVRDDDIYYHHTKGGALLMINSSSHNDQFINSNVLVNVDSVQGTLNKSMIVVNSRSVGRDTSWGSGGPFRLGDKREKYEHVRLLRTDVIDSEVSKGSYVDSSFAKSSITSGGKSNEVKSTNLTESRIHGARLELRGLRGEGLDVHSSGDITLKGISLLMKQTWRFSSIYVTNRFAFTEIDYLTARDCGIKMVRINPTEVEVRVHEWKDGFSLKLDATRPTIEEALRRAIEEDKGKKDVPVPALTPGFGFGAPFPGAYNPGRFGQPNPGETIQQVALQYLVDQVSSRLGMIQLMDEVEETAKCLNPNKSYEGDNFYD